MKQYITFLLLAFSSFCAYSSNQAGSDKLSIVFRYDDYMLNNNPVDEKIVSLFENYKVPLVIGVIPCDKNGTYVNVEFPERLNRIRTLISQGQIEVALHGLTHQRVAPQGEFSGLELKKQIERLGCGKLFLDSVFQTNVISFIPPWNAYDANTLLAMEACGLHTISSSLADHDVENTMISYYPHTIGELDRLDNVLKNKLYFGGVVVVMIHSYDFTTPASLKKLKTLLNQVCISPNYHLATFSSLYNQAIKIDGKAIKQLWHPNLAMRLMKTDWIILSASGLRVIKLINATLHVLICFVLLLIFCKLFKLKVAGIGYLVILLWLLLVGIIAYLNVVTVFKLLGLIFVCQIAFSVLVLKFGNGNEKLKDNLE